MITFKQYINEAIKVTKNNASKYFRLIEKGTKSKSWHITQEQNYYIVVFNGSKDGDFSFLVKDEKIIGYTLSGNTDWRLIPSILTSVKDLVKDWEIITSSGKKGKGMSSTVLIKKADNLISVSDEPTFDIDNKKYYGVKEDKLYRIYSKKAFSDVKKGDKGGLIGKESNLSDDECWVYGNAEVYGDSEVYDN